MWLSRRFLKDSTESAAITFSGIVDSISIYQLQIDRKISACRSCWSVLVNLFAMSAEVWCFRQCEELIPVHVFIVGHYLVRFDVVFDIRESIQGGPKTVPQFYFCDNFRKYIPIFTVRTGNLWCIKVKLCLPPHLYFETALPSKTRTTLISTLYDLSS